MSNNNDKNIKNMKVNINNNTNANANANTNANTNTNANIDEMNKIVHDYHENTMKPQFDFYKDFEIIENIQKKSSSNASNIDQDQNQNQNQTNDTDELNVILKSFPLVNENIRNNVKLSMEIYKTICNFDYYYIHNAIDENMKK